MTAARAETRRRFRNQRRALSALACHSSARGHIARAIGEVLLGELQAGKLYGQTATRELAAALALVTPLHNPARASRTASDQ